MIRFAKRVTLRCSIRTLHPSSYVRNQLPFSAQHCRQLVYRSSWENYICILSINNQQHQRSLFALHAYNAAILTSIEKVSKPVFAQARIQFLKDGISKIYKNEIVPEHPVLDEIKIAIQNHKYPKAWMMRLINERMKDEIISKKSFDRTDQIEKYSELTLGSILLLSLKTVEVNNADADMAARNAARCIGLTNSLRAQV
jgi:phytoene/squalene synthetase